ncbi:MAG: hypothetical protein MRJ68_22190 [Nitrospira sp.]|nr:hypothetical protein [Nitrospira sp.]
MRDLLASLRGRIYRGACRLFWKNIKIGEGLRIYKKLSITGKGKLVIGKNCIIGGALGDSSQYVTLDTHSETATIQIGNNAVLNAARVSSKFEIIIGNDVLIEQAGLLDTDFHSIDKSRQTPQGETRERCRIVVGDRVCIGARSFITRGVKIEDDVLVFPGSVVTSQVKAGSCVGGNPAKLVA